MPVLGHAVVGWATAACTRPSRGRAAASAFWVPGVIGLAYLPDVLAQLIQLADLRPWQSVAHSVILAVPVSLGAGAVLARTAGISFRRAFLIALASMFLHDVLDVLHGENRTLLWPLSDRTVRFDWGRGASAVWAEILLYGALAAAFWGWRRLMRRRHPLCEPRRHPGCAVPACRFWFGRCLTAAILLCALGTLCLRGLRAHDYKRAQVFLAGRHYAEALTALNQADVWPYAVSLHEMDYARGKIYAGLGDRNRAKHFYLRAIDSDPSCFWALADLADFYASSAKSADERRREAAPYVERLRHRFVGHKECPRVLAKLERKLAAPSKAVVSAGGR